MGRYAVFGGVLLKALVAAGLLRMGNMLDRWRGTHRCSSVLLLMMMVVVVVVEAVFSGSFKTVSSFPPDF